METVLTRILKMPTYTYECDACECTFELFSSIKDYKSSPKCLRCNSHKTSRLLAQDALTLNSNVKKSDSELKTIGDLANRNRDKMSDDEKNYLHKKHNAYKEEPSNKPLPTGMSRMKKPPKPPKNLLRRLQK